MTANEYLSSANTADLVRRGDECLAYAPRSNPRATINPLRGSTILLCRFLWKTDDHSTKIRPRHVIYWPSTETYTIKGIYDAVGKVLKKNWNIVNSKTVSWELPFEGGFHIDVVPGRALDSSFKEVANLYGTDTGRH